MNYISNKKKSSKRLYVFAGLLTVSAIFIVLFRVGYLDLLNGLVQSAMRPVQSPISQMLAGEKNGEAARLREENSELRMKIIRMQILEQDNKALRDQFATEQPKSRNLLPASVISIPSVLPRTDTADHLIIDKGKGDNIQVNDPVIYKDSLVGFVGRISGNLSVVKLVNHSSTSFTARTLETKAEGIIKGSDEQKIIFDKVLLADNLKTGDTVVGEFPDVIIIGKIKDINKKASDLFQAAEIEQIIDVKSLTKVFILRSNQ